MAINFVSNEDTFLNFSVLREKQACRNRRPVLARILRGSAIESFDETKKGKKKKKKRRETGYSFEVELRRAREETETTEKDGETR